MISRISLPKSAIRKMARNKSANTSIIICLQNSSNRYEQTMNFAVCSPGYFGPFCNSTCPPKSFGAECGGYCVKCSVEECDHVHGCPPINQNKSKCMMLVKKTHYFYLSLYLYNELRINLFHCRSV